MCGRYAARRRPADLVEDFGLVAVDDTARVVAPTHNRAPTDVGLVVRSGRVLTAAAWGLRLPWGSTRPINARSETVAERPAFRRALTAGRCVVPADGWYEWTRSGRGRQPWFLTGDCVALAGIAEPGTPSYAVLTRSADPAIAHLHDRMPLLLPPHAWAWLDPAVGPAAAVRTALAIPPPPLRWWPVAPLVNRVGTDGPDLVRPLPDPLDAALF